MAGSMGSVVGEKLTRCAEEADQDEASLHHRQRLRRRRPHARGNLVLMQMAKISAALARYDQAGGLYISILTNPTMGGVAASFALQGDITLAEPAALIGFAATNHLEHRPHRAPEASKPASPPQARLRRPYHCPPRPRTELARIIDYCENPPA